MVGRLVRLPHKRVGAARVVLYQYDQENSMNPHGLLIAYAEDFVKPVVSDFDTFTASLPCYRLRDRLSSFSWVLGGPTAHG